MELSFILVFWLIGAGRNSSWEGTLTPFVYHPMGAAPLMTVKLSGQWARGLHGGRTRESPSMRLERAKYI